MKIELKEFQYKKLKEIRDNLSGGGRKTFNQAVDKLIGWYEISILKDNKINAYQILNSDEYEWEKMVDGLEEKISFFYKEKEKDQALENWLSYKHYCFIINNNGELPKEKDKKEHREEFDYFWKDAFK